jgi:hypothetical protein
MLKNCERFAAILGLLMMYAIRLIVATVSAFSVALAVIPAGASERGHAAFGGEHLLILAAWILGFWASSVFFRRRTK